MLNVPLPSPPVPTTSIAPSGRLDADDPLAHRRREAGQLVDGLAAHPQAHQSAASWAGVASPSMTAPIAARASSIDSVPPSTIVASAARTIVAHRRPPVRSPTGSAEPGRGERARSRSSSRDASPFAGLAQEVREQVRALRRQHRLRVELDALERQRDVADAHDHPVDLAHRGHPQLRRQRRGIDRQRVIAGGHERRRHALEQPGAVVGHLGRLAVDERRGADDRRPERGRHRLHPEADAEEREAALGGDLDRPDRDRRRRPDRPARAR